MKLLNNKGLTTIVIVIIIVCAVVVVGGIIGGVVGYNIYQEKKQEEEALRIQEELENLEASKNDAVNNHNDSVNATNEENGKIIVKNQDLLGITYGELKARYGNDLKAEFQYHGDYYVTVPQLGVDFVFHSDSWNMNDSDVVKQISGKLGNVVSGLNGKMKIDEFTNKLDSYKQPATFELKRGAGTSYYISDYYAEVHFQGQYKDVTAEDKENGMSDSWGGCLYIAVDEDDTVNPESFVWLSRVAG